MGQVKQCASCWNWLTPLVEHISKDPGTKVKVNFFKNTCKITCAGGIREIKRKGSDLITSVYKTCVEYIKWFNQQNL